jgi:alanyl-tRNA synthetase
VENKLYYQDAYIQSFFSRVVRQANDDEGLPYIVLEETAFYPTGGGQPNDIGTINDINVINVEEIDGEIRHYLENPLPEIRKEVFGVIDWERRFDHMQQHAGQHILSAAFDSIFHFKTVGFHLGREILTIDLETEHLSEREAEEAENLANQIIIENRPIETKWITEEELSQYAMRKETKVKEDIRLVIIPEFDYNGCGGTHPKTTGEVRAVKILDWEKQKKKIRLQFICGNRVLEQFQHKQKVLLQLTKQLNVPEREMEAAVYRILDHAKALEKALEGVKENILLYEAKELLINSNTGGREIIISQVYQDRTIQELQKLARLITNEEEMAYVFFVAENEDRLQIVVARGVKGSLNMKKLIGEALTRINGKGGGNEMFAQGGGEALMEGREILEILMNYKND